MEVNKSDVTFPSPTPHPPQPSGSASTPAPLTSQKPTTSSTTAQPGRRKQAKPQRKPGKLSVKPPCVFVVRDVSVYTGHGGMEPMWQYLLPIVAIIQHQDHLPSHCHNHYSHSDSDFNTMTVTQNILFKSFRDHIEKWEWKTLFFISSGH